MKSFKLALAAVSVAALAGCYVVTTPDGRVYHVIPGDAGVPPRGLGGLPAAAPSGPALPATLPV
ncbi:MAG TPA: hypothetical protein VFV84_05050, partial [Burkholderiales bacterium]|nr:hypothetical protein [Burkholderiales bacterium]